MVSGTGASGTGGVRLLAVGGSAGGVDALRRFVSGLPADLPATVLVTLHLGTGSPGLLAPILARTCALRVVEAQDGLALEAGTLVVARPDIHLGVLDGLVRLGHGAPEHLHRPSIDLLLRSVALEAGDRAVGVVLTGMLDDGAAGLAAVATYGGAALVQSPCDAEFPSMPEAALDAVPAATALGLDDLAAEAVRLLLSAPSPGPAPDPGRRRRDEAEVRAAFAALPPHQGATGPHTVQDVQRTEAGNR